MSKITVKNTDITNDARAADIIKNGCATVIQ